LILRRMEPSLKKTRLDLNQGALRSACARCAP
jgi:hypothetical protein